MLGAPFGVTGIDYNGNGTAESFQAEIDGMLELLLSEIQAYAVSTLGTAIVYAPGSFPNIQNITLATLQSAPAGIGTHGTISTWTTEEQQAVVDFLTNPL